MSCQYSFPNETYLLKHDCRGYQDAADYDDQAIDNIITDSLETEVDIEFEAPKIQTYQPEEDQGKVRRKSFFRIVELISANRSKFGRKTFANSEKA